ncbi:hypothetical protein TNCV_1403031 [Trichonephila clavipes]|nr:hypothetical protein TNCV_1403031 [Trichonephila clavipes]
MPNHATRQSILNKISITTAIYRKYTGFLFPQPNICFIAPETFYLLCEEFTTKDPNPLAEMSSSLSAGALGTNRYPGVCPLTNAVSGC